MLKENGMTVFSCFSDSVPCDQTAKEIQPFVHFSQHCRQPIGTTLSPRSSIVLEYYRNFDFKVVVEYTPSITIPIDPKLDFEFDTNQLFEKFSISLKNVIDKKMDHRKP